MSAMEVQRFSKTLGLLVVLHGAGKNIQNRIRIELLSRIILLLKLYKHLSLAIAKDNDGWLIKAPTEVRAIEGYPVVLPCSFTHPHHTHPSSMHVLWTLGHGRAATVLFRCTSLNNSQQCQSKINQDQRYRLEGNHRNHDISLRINSVTLNDSDRYYCRLELPGHPHSSFENTLGTRLRVEGKKNNI